MREHGSKVVFGKVQRRSKPAKSVRPPTEAIQSTVVDVTLDSSGALGRDTSWDIDLPSAAVSGDLILISISTEAGSGVSLNTPTGWTALVTNSVGGAGNHNFYRIADGSETDTVTFTSATAHRFSSVAWVVKSNGIDFSTYTPENATPTDGTAPDINFPAFTPSTTDVEWWVFPIYGINTATDLGNPTNYDELGQITHAGDVVRPMQVNVSYAKVDISTSEDPTSLTYTTYSGDAWVAHVIAVVATNPAGGSVAAGDHTHTESDVTDLDHWTEADHDALDHTGLTGIPSAIDSNTNVDRVGGVVSTKQITADAAPYTVYTNEPHGWYDVASHRTFIAFLGLDRDLYATYYDHQAGDVATPVLVGAYPLDVDDSHGAPVVTVDHDGYIHIVWGSHAESASLTPHKYSVSDSPWDISAWTTSDLDSGDGTYPHLSVNPANGDLYVLDRVGNNSSGSFPDNKRYLGLRKSTDGGSTWSAVSQIVDTGGDLAYLGGAMWAPDGYLHICWTFDPDSGAVGGRTYIHHAKFDGSTWYTADGTDLGSDISSTEQANNCRVEATETEVGIGTLDVSTNGNIGIVYWADDGVDSRYVVSTWDGSSWTKAVLTTESSSNANALGTIWAVRGGWRALVSVDNGSFIDLVLFGTLKDGGAWGEIDTILTGSSGEGFGRVGPVRGGGPIVALAGQIPASFVETNATSSDLLPLVAVFDGAGGGEQTVLSNDDPEPIGATADDGTSTEGSKSDHVHTVAGSTVRDAGRWEVVVSGSSPPVAVETEDGTDWVYAWVSS